MISKFRPVFPILLQLAFIIMPQATFSQNAPPVQWFKTYGFASWDEAWSAQQTSDGGYVLAGYTDLYYANSHNDIYIVKTDPIGNIVWQKIYGGPDDDYATWIQQTKDGGYIIAAATESYGFGRYDFYLIKIDSQGNAQWQRTYGDRYDEIPYYVQQTSDGGYIITGFTTSFGAEGDDVYVLKTDSLGNVIWQKTYGGKYNDVAYCINETSDKGYIIAGGTRSFGSGGNDMYLLKTDSWGNLIWQKTFGGSLDDRAMSVMETFDGGFFIAGESNSYGAGGADIYLVKTDGSGNLLWQKTYGGPADELIGWANRTKDGGFIIAADTGGYSNNVWSEDRDIYLIQVDDIGDLIWQKIYNMPSCEHSMFVQQTSDGGFAIAGLTSSFGAGQFDAFLMKLAPEKDTYFPPGIRR